MMAIQRLGLMSFRTMFDGTSKNLHQLISPLLAESILQCRSSTYP